MSLHTIQAFTNGCEKFAQPDVGEQLLETLVHDTLREHPQLELADDPDRTNALTFRFLGIIFFAAKRCLPPPPPSPSPLQQDDV